MSGSFLMVRRIIREQDPLKQGLKPYKVVRLASSAVIREQDPLKQGLKHIIFYNGLRSINKDS